LAEQLNWVGTDKGAGWCGACGVARNHAPGGQGAPSAPTRWGCLRWLDEVRKKWKPPGSGMPRARKHGPKAQNRRQWSAVGRVRDGPCSQQGSPRTPPVPAGLASLNGSGADTFYGCVW